MSTRYHRARQWAVAHTLSACTECILDKVYGQRLQCMLSRYMCKFDFVRTIKRKSNNFENSFLFYSGIMSMCSRIAKHSATLARVTQFKLGKMSNRSPSIARRDRRIFAIRANKHTHKVAEITPSLLPSWTTTYVRRFITDWTVFSNRFRVRNAASWQMR